MIFFGPKRLRDFFWSQEVGYFFVPRGCMIFFGPKRLCVTLEFWDLRLIECVGVILIQGDKPTNVQTYKRTNVQTNI